MTDTPKTVDFKGRKIVVKTPSSVQVAAWNRTADKFGEFGQRGEEGAELTEAEGEEFRGLLDKLFRIVISLFEQQADKDWFEDLALDGEVTDEDLLSLFTDAAKGLKDDAEKGPATKKAARRR